ncbi:MAG TPA: radical SAM protein, partial [Nitrososphaerales archaeon]|nr:radical SAM protein [Nitrososphaerales archaeon]
MEVRETKCKSVLHEMSFGGSREYTANFYRGCSHGCIYCYAQSLVHQDRPWGSFVDVKVNAPEVIETETRRMRPCPVFLSSATDPYQPVEAKYRLTRRCLEVLVRREFEVTILTRSPLVLRDLDLLRAGRVSVGMSISSVSTRYFEPGVPPLERRLSTLSKLSSEGIETWVSMAPIFPSLMLDDVENLAARLKEVGVTRVSAGVARWAGYEVSRRFFEEKTGMSADAVSEDTEGVLAGVKASL